MPELSVVRVFVIQEFALYGFAVVGVRVRKP